MSWYFKDYHLFDMPWCSYAYEQTKSTCACCVHVPQVESLQHEVENLQGYQGRLQEDYEELQAMAEARQQEIENLTRDLSEIRPQAEGMSDQMQVGGTVVYCNVSA